ncbi:MAG: ImmA/IrrE family metallo-endopeptidase [Ruminococcaceae bacterium]|nr:ImmA/IrrE family metallo-endopeptidase [Oscillospiraceae bacterium]
MTSLDLLKYAESKGIIIEYSKLPEVGSCAVDLDGLCVIGIDDRDMTEAEKRVHLAHELGHCETGAFYNMYSPVDNRSKNEYKANAWAIKKILPKERMLDAFKNGLTEKWQLAEEFSVTEEFIVKAFNYYFQQN